MLLGSLTQVLVCSRERVSLVFLVAASEFGGKGKKKDDVKGEKRGGEGRRKGRSGAYQAKASCSEPD